jgi:hypothetical protein
MPLAVASREIKDSLRAVTNNRGRLVAFPMGFGRIAPQPGRGAFGHSVEYNEPAAKDAEEKTRAFLAAHLAGTSPAVGNRR